ncbi:MAG: hypothetical protein M3O71_23040 [Bacteroidota bacterium]|nr:hypothetical protein [Bacteroidota bacterium]
MKKLITAAMLFGAFSIVSCQKELNLKPTVTGGTPIITASGSSSTGGGGKTGGGTTTPVTSPAPPTDTVRSALPIGTLITVGTWKVTSYMEGIQNGTSKFADYTFNFEATGKISAHQGGNSFFGTWLYVNAIFYYGVPIYGSSPDGFNIRFGTVRPLILLGKNLFISKKTTTNFYLSSVNPAENTHITFTKISN